MCDCPSINLVHHRLIASKLTLLSRMNWIIFSLLAGLVFCGPTFGQHTSSGLVLRSARHSPATQQKDAPAQPPVEPDVSEGLTLENVRALALANHPSIERAWSMYQAAQGNAWQVGLPPNPEAGYLGQQLGSGGQAEQHGLLLQKEFVRGGKLELNRGVAEQDVIRASYEFSAQQQRVTTSVSVAYYEGLIAQRRSELARQLVEIAREGVNTVEQLRKAGESSRSDLLQATLELESAELVVNSASVRHESALRNLTAAIGINELPSSILLGDIEVNSAGLDWTESLERLLAESPEIAIAFANIEKAQREVCRAQVETVPNVTIQGVVMQDNAIGGRTDGILQITMPIPVLNNNSGAIRKAQAEHFAALKGMEQTKVELRARLSQTYERYTNATQQVDRYRNRIIPTSKESLELVRQGFVQGQFPYLNLLNAQRTFFQTNLQYLDSLRELQIASAEIEGLLLTASQPK